MSQLKRFFRRREETHIKRNLIPPRLPRLPRLPNLQQLHNRIALLPQHPIHPLIMPQNLPRRPLQHAPLLIEAGLGDRRAQGAREDGDDGGVLLGEVVELDGGGEEVVGFGLGGGGEEDVCVVGAGGGEVQQGEGVFDYAVLNASKKIKICTQKFRESAYTHELGPIAPHTPHQLLPRRPPSSPSTPSTRISIRQHDDPPDQLPARLDLLLAHTARLVRGEREGVDVLQGLFGVHAHELADVPPDEGGEGEGGGVCGGEGYCWVK